LFSNVLALKEFWFYAKEFWFYAKAFLGVPMSSGQGASSLQPAAHPAKSVPVEQGGHTPWRDGVELHLC